MNILDISTDLLTAEVYPGDPDPRLHLINRLDCDDDFNISAIYAGLHTGTHIDAPAHVFEEGAETIDELPLDRFIGPVQIVTLPDGPITGEIVENYFPKDKSKVILRTGENTVFFGGAAEDAARLEYELLGFDKTAIGGSDEVGFHRAFLGSGTILLEGLDLSKVTNDGEYFLFAPPIKLEGREAAFCRAVLIEDYIFWSSKKNGI